MPVDMATDMPVELSHHSVHVPKVDWVVDVKQIRLGLLTAHTILL